MAANRGNEYYIPKSSNPEKTIKINEHDILMAFNKRLYCERIQVLVFQLVLGTALLALILFSTSVTLLFLCGLIIPLALIILSSVLLKNTAAKRNAVLHQLQNTDDSDISDKHLREFIIQCRQEPEESRIKQERLKKVGKMPSEQSDENFQADSHYQDGYPF